MARMRSPNYPSIALPQAIDFIEKIFAGDRVNVIDKDVAAGHMGYSGLNGRTLKLLGALSQYGLLDKVGKGKVRVSSTAVSILHGETEEEKGRALLEAASSPPLFKRIRDTYDSPSDATITSFLMREGFTDAAVGPVLKSYSDTNAFLTSKGVFESYGNDEEDGADSSPDDIDQGTSEMNEAQTSDMAAAPPPPQMQQAPALDPVLNSTKPKFDFESVEIITKIDNRDDLDELMDRLAMIKGMLPTKVGH